MSLKSSGVVGVGICKGDVKGDQKKSFCPVSIINFSMDNVDKIRSINHTESLRRIPPEMYLKKR